MLGIDLDRADHGNQEDLRIVASASARALSQLVLRTDIAGANGAGIDSLLIAGGGIHEAEFAGPKGIDLGKIAEMAEAAGARPTRVGKIFNW